MNQPSSNSAPTPHFPKPPSRLFRYRSAVYSIVAISIAGAASAPLFVVQRGSDQAKQNRQPLPSPAQQAKPASVALTASQQGNSAHSSSDRSIALASSAQSVSTASVVQERTLSIPRDVPGTAFKPQRVASWLPDPASYVARNSDADGHAPLPAIAIERSVRRADASQVDASQVDASQANASQANASQANAIQADKSAPERESAPDLASVTAAQSTARAVELASTASLPQSRNEQVDPTSQAQEEVVIVAAASPSQAEPTPAPVRAKAADANVLVVSTAPAETVNPDSELAGLSLAMATRLNAPQASLARGPELPNWVVMGEGKKLRVAR